MPRPRWQTLPPERRAPILAAAEAEFAARGYAEASYNRIIAAAGVSKGAMYYYFDDKEDLFVEVVRRALAPYARFAEVPDAVADAVTFWREVDARCAEAMGALEASPALTALGRAVYEALKAGAPDGPLARMLASMDDRVDAAIALGQGVGAVRSDLPRPLLARVTVAAFVAMDRWFVERWETLPPDELPALAQRSLGLFRDLLEPR